MTPETRQQIQEYIDYLLENSSADWHDSCPPSVTPVTLEKGCKRPVYRHSDTLSPLKKKILVYNR